MLSTHHRTAFYLKLIIVIVAWLSLILQFYLLVSRAAINGLTRWEAGSRFFAYFTILTNLLVALGLSFSLRTKSGRFAGFLSSPSVIAATTLYIFIVGLVYNVVLRYTWSPTGLQKWVDEGLHVVVPLLFVVYWYFFTDHGRLQWKNVFAWLIYPAAYLVYALLIGQLSGFYTYPFINVTQLGVAKVLLNAVVLMIVFIAFGLLTVVVDTRLGRRKLQT